MKECKRGSKTEREREREIWEKNSEIRKKREKLREKSFFKEKIREKNAY